MPCKCSIGGCKSNYDTETETVSTYGFPLNDPDQLQRWIDAVPNVLPARITKSMRVCVKHWPPGYETYRKKGYDLPVNPPSVFSVPTSYLRQTAQITPRHVEARNVDADSRRKKIAEAKPIEPDPDIIKTWTSLEEFCAKLHNVNVTAKDDRIILSDISGDPPKLTFSLTIFNNFTVSCYKGLTKVAHNDLINGFTHKVEKYSQIDNLLERLRKTETNVSEEIKNSALNIKDLIDMDPTEDEEKTKVRFLVEQLILQSKKVHGERYDANMMRTAICLYLRSRNCYSALREYLTLPHPDTIKNYFGTLGSPGEIADCENTLKEVFNKLSGKERYCKVLVDEIHIKPAVRYQGNHVVGFSCDDPTKAARTVVAIMIAPSMGKPAFVCRLIPVFSLVGEFLFEQIKKIIELVHKNGGYVFLLMCDNLRTNQKCFNLFKRTFGSDNIYSCHHPVSNEEFSLLFVLYDPTHLLKNIRNNWQTEKMQKLKFTCPDDGSVVTALWSDLIKIYKSEEHSLVKSTKLNYATLFPTNFEKQKVSLAVNVFNEKTVAELKLRGYVETAKFVDHVTRLWNILNVKSPDAGRNLNDKNRVPFRSVDDERFKFIDEMADKFKDMDVSLSKYTNRVMCLTVDTSNALHLTLKGISALIKLLLTKGFSYVLPGTFQSDRLEGEFGIYRQSCGGCYYISVQQIMNSLALQRLKLFDKLEIQSNSVHIDDACCTALLDEDELRMLDECFEKVNKLTETEKSNLYYISGYVAAKEQLSVTVDEIDEKQVAYSEFTTLLSRGKLSYPPSELFDLSCVLFAYYKEVEKSCITHLMDAFQHIYESCYLTYENDNRILRRFLNSFSKAFSNDTTDGIRVDKKKNSIKRRRLTHQ